MPNRRRKIRPRTDIPNWRDPEMPVLREYLMADGTKRTWVEPNYERRYREHMMSTAAQPHHTSDPSYNWSTRK